MSCSRLAMAWMFLSSPSASCLISASRVSTAASFFSPKATCARRSSSCLNILFGAGELILGGLNLADGVALPALHAIELAEQLVLDRRSMRASSSDSACIWRVRSATSAATALLAATSSAYRFCCSVIVASSYLMLPMRSCAVSICVRSTLISATSGTRRVCSARTSTELVLRVHHLLGEAVAGRLERLELRAAGELILQLAIDVGADGVEAVQAAPPASRRTARAPSPARAARRARPPLRSAASPSGCLLRRASSCRGWRPSWLRARARAWRARSSAR